MPTQEIPRMMRGVSLRQALIGLWCLVAVGCAEVTNEAPQPASQTIETAAAGVTPPDADDAAPEPLSSAAVVVVSDAAENLIHDPPPATEPEPAAPTVSPGNIVLAASEAAPVEAAAPVAREPEPEPSLIPPLAASPTSAETLDFASLVTRLRKTKAINLRTKVLVKNESDDLLQQFHAYHTQTGETTLADLRRAYDSLFHELHSLLEDTDPPLARDIDRSQAAIWELLADPSKFNASI